MQMKDKIRKYIIFAKKINIKSIYFNFKYLPLKDAIKIPFLLSKNVYLRKVNGQIRLNCKISTGIVLIGYKNVGIFDEKNSRTIWEVEGKVVFNGKATIGHGSKIIVGKEGELLLGRKFSISAESSIIAFSKIIFGDNCLLSWDILLMDSDFHKIIDVDNKIINKPEPIKIGNNVWIGCQNLILKGTIIPDNCVIGAKSLISKKLFVSDALYAGNPIKLIKENIRWEH